MLDLNTKLELCGRRQRIHIRTEDETRPVLLFLHGGPGVCNRHAIFTEHRDLLDTFTIAEWDQRGSGGSYWGVRREELTVAQLTEDAWAYVQWLCARFSKDKIFVIGGSWGSELGTWLCYRHPERVAAFVGFGQVVNGQENERISYDFTLRAAQQAGDRKAVRALERVGPPVKGCYRGGFRGLMTQRNLMMKYGGYSQSSEKRSYYRSFVVPVLKSGEYTPGDLLGLILGYRRVLRIMWPEVGGTDFHATCTRFQVPMLIFDGKQDRNTPWELVQDWFDAIRAPQKELIWFEHSGHNPMGDEPERFKTLLRTRLLAIQKQEECRI